MTEKDGPEELSALERWEKKGREKGWKMPATKWWKRLPLIRRVRALCYGLQVYFTTNAYAMAGAIDDAVPTPYSLWVEKGIAEGWEL